MLDAIVVSPDPINRLSPSGTLAADSQQGALGHSLASCASHTRYVVYVGLD